MMDDFEGNLRAATASVSAWDVAPEDVAQAVNDQARLLCLDYALLQSNPNPYIELQFYLPPVIQDCPATELPWPGIYRNDSTA